MLFYRLMKTLEYETANPGADDDGRVDHYVERYVEREPVPVPVVVDHQVPIESERRQSTPTRYMTTVDTLNTGRRVDGTDETEFTPPFHPINKPLGSQRARSKTPPNMTFTRPTASVSPEPDKPLPAYHHGGDGHQSPGLIDHPNDRPRAQHRSQSKSERDNNRPRGHHRSTRVRHSDPDSQLSYRSGPSVESASSSMSTEIGRAHV